MWTTKDLNQLMELRALGITYKNTAKLLGRSQGSVTAAVDSNTNATTTIGTNVSKTIIGTQINLRATTVNTLFGNNLSLSATLTVVGLDSGARLTIPITITKTT